VVPTSLDQPETAVAFGAHDVPREGISVRTQDLGNQLAPPPFSPRFPGTGPQQVGYPGYPMGGPASGPLSGPVSGPLPTAQYPAYPGAVPSHPSPGRRRTLLAVVGGILWFGRGGTTVDASCSGGGTPDTQGFVPCVRQLAGAVPDHARCQAAVGDKESAVSRLGSDPVACQLGSGSDTYSVVYMKATGSAQRVVGQMVADSGGDLVEAEWKGNGLTGRYEAGVDGGMGLLVFTVQDSPLLGVLTRVDFSSGHPPTPDELADYFERNVQPGT
jgi:hypothetical protein